MKKFLLSTAAAFFVSGLIAQSNVGISETSPASKLSVKGNASIGTGYSTTAAPANGAIIEGNVGIGTTGPAAKLHVNGGNIQLAQTAGQSPFEIISYNNASSLWFLSGNANSSTIVLSPNYAHDWDRSVSFEYTPGTTGVAAGALNIGQISKNNANFTHGITNLYTNGLPRVTVISNGNVGVGTASPAGRLDVKGAGNTSATYGFGVRNSSDNYIFTARNDGKVTVSTLVSNLPFEVNTGALGGSAGDVVETATFTGSNGNVNFLDIRQMRTSAGSSWNSAGTRIQQRIDATWMGYMQFNGDGNDYGISFGTGGTATAPGNVSERMRIASDGKVGIGTVSPSKTLDVNGDVRIRGGSPLAGKVLVSTNANGEATWLDASNIGVKYGENVTTGNWYRIASNDGTRANAEFTLRDNISSGGHSTLKFIAGTSFNDGSGASFTMLNHNIYSTVTFTKVRILQATTYDPQYLEVFVARTGWVDFSIKDNLQINGWVPVNWAAGSIPSGYTAREFDVNNLFTIGDYDDRLSVARGGNLTINNLAGTGNKLVYADANGTLTTTPTNYAKGILYGSVYIGDFGGSCTATSSPSGVVSSASCISGGSNDSRYTINISPSIASYTPFITVRSNTAAQWNNNNDQIVAVGNLTSTSFEVYLREVSGNTQTVWLDVMLMVKSY